MALYAYKGEGTGDIYGVGIVYPGLVFDDELTMKDADGKPYLDLSKDDRFEVSKAAEATTDAEKREQVNRAPDVVVEDSALHAEDAGWGVKPAQVQTKIETAETVGGTTAPGVTEQVPAQNAPASNTGA